MLLAAEDPAQRGQVQQIALVCADDQADVGHQQHDQDLQEALGMACGNAVTDDEREEVSAADSEEASDGGADQTLEADGAQLPFEQHDGCADESAHTRVDEASLPEGLNEEASDGYNNDKKKTYNNNIHGKPPRECSLPVCPNN